MYIDLIIILVLLLLGYFLSKRTNSFIYSIAIIDIFLRIMTFIKINLKVEEIQSLISKYLPESIPNIIDKYTSSVLTTILLWLYVGIMTIFLYFNIKSLLKKKK
ncbi:MAG: hypothetical protein PHQ64_02010 [Bacilli bacterium]|nr:hypothetical protein [Bacilli bacterium]